MEIVKKKFLITVLVITCVAGMLSLFLIYDYYTYIAQQIQVLRQSVQQEARIMSQVLEKHIAKKIESFQILINQASLQNFSQQELSDTLARFLTQQDFFSSIGVYYVPKENGNANGEQSFVYKRKNFEEFDKHIVPFQDYQRKNWFTETLLKKQEIWSEPFKNSYEGPVISFCSPLFFFDKKKDNYFVKAILVGEFELSKFEIIFEKLRTHHQFNMALFSKKGIILYHAAKQYVNAMLTIDQVVKLNGQKNLKPLINQMLVEADLTGRLLGDYERISEIDSSFQYINYIKMKKFEWNLVIVGQSYAQLKTSSVVQHKMIHLAISCSLFIFFFFFLLGYLYFQSTFIPWFLTICASCIFIGLIGFLWFLNRHKDMRLDLIKKGEVIQTNLQSSRFLKTIVRYQKDGLTLLEKQIPTGIFIDALEINKDNTIKIEGYIWHQLHKKVHEKLLKNDNPLVTFVGAYALSFKKAYHITRKNIETVGWKFSYSFFGDFDFSIYPLDHQVISLQLRSADLADPLIFSPDFTVLADAQVKKLKELAKEIKLPGWKLEETYKSYYLTQFPTSLGMRDASIQSNFPEFVLHVVIERSFLGILIGILLPLILTLLILFVTLILSSLPESHGVTIMSQVSIAGASMLATVIPHATLRGFFPFKVPYIEYAYFLTYLFIFLVLINNILICIKSPYFLISYRNNLLPKLFFWPAVTGIFFIVTLFHFY